MRGVSMLLVMLGGLALSTPAWAEVTEDEWSALVGDTVVLTNDAGQEVRGVLLSAEAGAVQVERADGSIVTVAMAEVASASALSAEPEPQSEPEPQPEPEPEPEPVPQVDPRESAKRGEVEGRAAAQSVGVGVPIGLSAGVGVCAGGCATAACGPPGMLAAIPAAAVTPAVYGLIKPTPPALLVAGQDEDYVYAFHSAYQKELRRRRLIMAGAGAGAGVAVGITMGLLQFYNLDVSVPRPG